MPKFREKKFFPRGTYNHDDTDSRHFYISSFMFMSGLMTNTTVPSAKRIVPNCSSAIECVRTITNTELSLNFERQKLNFEDQKRDSDEVLLFHGTSEKAIQANELLKRRYCFGGF